MTTTQPNLTRTILRLHGRDSYGDTTYTWTGATPPGLCSQSELQAMLAAGRTPYGHTPIIACDYQKGLEGQ